MDLPEPSVPSITISLPISHDPPQKAEEHKNKLAQLESQYQENIDKIQKLSDEERNKMTELLDSGFIDTYRHFNPFTEGAYSWWSYRFNARKNNSGWRIDYFIVSNKIKNKIKEAKIDMDIFGSDHCPVELTLDI